MNIKLELPEILILCSAALFISQSALHGWIFFSLGLLGSIFRLGLELQEKQQQATAVKEGVDALKGSAEEFLDALNGALGSNTNKKNRNNLN